MNLLNYLPDHYSLACFDFLGCGNNDEDGCTTLGVRESEQIKTVVDYLRTKKYKVYLWGRSMGASSALKYGKASIIVADSPFRSFKKLCKEIVVKSESNPFPSCMVTCLFPCVFLKLRSDVKSLANYDVEELNIEKDVQNIDSRTTIIFMSGTEDKLVHHYNSEKLYKIFSG